MFLNLLNMILEGKLFQFQSQIKGFTTILLFFFFAALTFCKWYFSVFVGILTEHAPSPMLKYESLFHDNAALLHVSADPTPSAL